MKDAGLSPKLTSVRAGGEAGSLPLSVVTSAGCGGVLKPLKGTPPSWRESGEEEPSGI